MQESRHTQGLEPMAGPGAYVPDRRQANPEKWQGAHRAGIVVERARASVLSLRDRTCNQTADPLPRHTSARQLPITALRYTLLAPMTPFGR